MRTRALPLRTLVPMKTTFVRAASPASAGTTPGCFSTGKVSPVSTAWLTKKSRASSTSPSAGIRLPAESKTTSPGTMSAVGTETVWPSRTTSALNAICALSFSAALWALYSW